MSGWILALYFFGFWLAGVMMGIAMLAWSIQGVNW